MGGNVTVTWNLGDVIGEPDSPQQVAGVTDWILSPVEQTKKLLAERAAEKAKEELKDRQTQEAEWARSGQPWSKKLDTGLTIAKWGIVAYLITALYPLIRGTSTALYGAGKALGGIGDAAGGLGAAAREGAESVRSVRQGITRRNPAPRPESYTGRRRRLGELSLHFAMLAKSLEAGRGNQPAGIQPGDRHRIEGAAQACWDLWKSDYTRTATALLSSRRPLRAHLNRWRDAIRRHRLAGEKADELFAVGYWYAYAAGIAFLEDPNQQEPTATAPEARRSA